MITRLLTDGDKLSFDTVVTHPVQTWAWGEFEKLQGNSVFRLGMFEDGKLISGYTVSFKKLPRLKYTIGKCLRGPIINFDMVANLKKIADENNAIFIKLEPDVPEFFFENGTEKRPYYPQIDTSQVRPSPKSLFFPYSFILDISSSEEDLLKAMHEKTRYNIRLANRHGVEVKEESNPQGLKVYLDLQQLTTARQNFYLHTPKYFRDLWNQVGSTGMVKILNAYFQGKPIASAVVMILNKRLFYAYAASSNDNREVMAPHLVMWEAIRLGKSLGCTSFDMWGCLGPNAKEFESGYGFHKFKQGFAGTLTQYVGTFDLVLKPQLYKLFNLLDQYRWKLLRLKAKIRGL